MFSLLYSGQLVYRASDLDLNVEEFSANKAKPPR